jgi:hypothetical protein
MSKHEICAIAPFVNPSRQPDEDLLGELRVIEDKAADLISLVEWVCSEAEELRRLLAELHAVVRERNE